MKKRVRAALALVLLFAALTLLPSSARVSAAAEGWRQNAKGWWYQFEDGTWPAEEWLQVSGKWYYFGADGYMKTGWLQLDGKWYYLRNSGAMATGWLQLDGKWYYFNPGGSMVTGWKLIDEKWYCFSGGGRMLTGWQKINGSWYYFKSGGSMTTAWQKIDGSWYYFSAGGKMQTGWVLVDSSWYYLGTNGVMQHDTVVDNCVLGSDGSWYKSVPVSTGNGTYSYVLVFTDGYYEKITGINLNLASSHKYYTYETTEQAVEADAACKYYADQIKKDPELTTDLDKVWTAAYIVASYCKYCTYGKDAENHYRSPYGVFGAGVYTCAGSTRALGRILDYMGYTWTHTYENQDHHQWCQLTMDGQVGYADGMAGLADYGAYPYSD